MIKKLFLVLILLFCTSNLFAVTSHLNPYFIMGNETHQAKFFANFDQELIEGTNVYFSYNLLAYWDVLNRSSPFKSYNHNPSIFWEIRDLSFIDFIRMIPYEHTSNGLAGWDSQSMDRYFYEMQISFGKIVNIGMTEKVGGYYGYTHREGIPTARRVYGFFKTTFFIQTNKKQWRFGHERLSFQGEWTKRFYWYQIDFSVRLFTSKFSPHILCQLYQGYGEDIGSHWIKTDRAYRFGLQFPI